MIKHRSTLLAAAVAALFAAGAAAEGPNKDPAKSTDVTTNSFETTPADPTAKSTDAPTEAASTTVATSAGEPIDDKMEEVASAGEEIITDAKFFERAAAANMLEIELGNLSQEKAASADVKAFGARMVTDHTKKLDELEALAATKNVTLPTALPDDQQAVCDRLDSLPAAEFDEGYMDLMVRAHREMDHLLTKTAAQTADNDIRTFAQETLKGVQDHYAHAQKLDAANVVAGTEDDTKE